ncbi:hypothetical protein B0H34DRAFT_856036 [Crassisporium funariophilum]|nr:hypothetical protein B0H34DRAFT_856036 [Crassisporium funariophilum]
MPLSNPEARGLSLSARDIDMINEIVSIAVREGLESRGSAFSSEKKKKEEHPPSYKKVGKDKPPPWTQGTHPVSEFHSEWDPNQPHYDNNHKSAPHHGGR